MDDANDATTDAAIPASTKRALTVEERAAQRLEVLRRAGVVPQGARLGTAAPANGKKRPLFVNERQTPAARAAVPTPQPPLPKPELGGQHAASPFVTRGRPPSPTRSDLIVEADVARQAARDAGGNLDFDLSERPRSQKSHEETPAALAAGTASVPVPRPQQPLDVVMPIERAPAANAPSIAESTISVTTIIAGADESTLAVTLSDAPEGVANAAGAMAAELALMAQGHIELGSAKPGAIEAGPIESGPVDSGPIESGPVDSGLIESGPVDSGPVESGPVDSGPIESGLTVPSQINPADRSHADGNGPQPASLATAQANPTVQTTAPARAAHSGETTETVRQSGSRASRRQARSRHAKMAAAMSEVARAEAAIASAGAVPTVGSPRPAATLPTRRLPSTRGPRPGMTPASSGLMVARLTPRVVDIDLDATAASPLDVGGKLGRTDRAHRPRIADRVNPRIGGVTTRQEGESTLTLRVEPPATLPGALRPRSTPALPATLPTALPPSAPTVTAIPPAPSAATVLARPPVVALVESATAAAVLRADTLAQAAARTDATDPVPAAQSAAPAPTMLNIDMDALRWRGDLTPDGQTTRLADEMGVITQPLLAAMRGQVPVPVARARRLLVTSALPAEGRTTMAINLAMSLVSQGARVVLMDVDPLRPRLAARLGLPAVPGLANVLRDRLPVAQAVHATNVAGLWVMPAGTGTAVGPLPLASGAMVDILKTLERDFPDAVLLMDAPPVLKAAQTVALAQRAGQVILVVHIGVTAQSAVADAAQRLQTCPVVYTLMNRLAPTADGSQYDRFGHYGNRPLAQPNGRNRRRSVAAAPMLAPIAAPMVLQGQPPDPTQKL